jgi:hypothetical protein
LEALEKVDNSKKFLEYFQAGKFEKMEILRWAENSIEGRMPSAIIDKRKRFGS